MVQRWNQRLKCTRCQQRQPVGADVRQLMTSRYQPMPDGPEWEAVGDWAEPQVSGGILCEDCCEDLTAFMSGWDDHVRTRYEHGGTPKSVDTDKGDELR